MIQPTNVKNPCNVPKCERPAPIIYNTDYNAIKISINGASVNAPAANPNPYAGQGAYSEQYGRNDGYNNQQGAPSYYNYPQANLYDYPQAGQQAYYAPMEKPVNYAPPAESVAQNYYTDPINAASLPPQLAAAQPAVAQLPASQAEPVEVPQPQVVQNSVSTPVIQPQIMQQNINYAVANAPAPIITEDAKVVEEAPLEVKDDAAKTVVVEDAVAEEIPTPVVAEDVAAVETPEQAVNEKNDNAEMVSVEEAPAQTIKEEAAVAAEKTATQTIAADKVEAEAVTAEAVAAAAVAAEETPVQTAKAEAADSVEEAAFVADEAVQDAPKVEIREPEELKPQIDINAFIAELTNPDFDKQALTMESIALMVRQEPEKATELLDEGVINALKGILDTDTRDLIGPTKEQTEARVKIMQGKKVSDIEKELANTMTPLEQAERNKSYALFTMAILEKLFNSEVEKLSGQIVPFKDIPGIMTVVEHMSSNQNPTVRASAVEALYYVQRPEYKDDLNALFKIALNDPDRAVRETAKAASDRLNDA